MIKYALACEQAHDFESWFPTSDAFDEQSRRGLVSCPFCHSLKIHKQVMAPALTRADKAPASAEPVPQPVAALSEKDRDLRAMIKAMREHVMANSENVGRGFADEARKMHYGEVDHRSIYGEANGEEARSLIEEGIAVMPLPILAGDRN
ncbi:DUF1178 family protein [Microvirga antarctica]|uniref:DUF1178 family protein n=1 Tax=Microvirga antarctica TaxID=2819233 RepID=UPI001B303D63|nr:DUF1178 family protein [Microvirga antarctica]